MKEPSEILQHVPIFQKLSEKELDQISSIGVVRGYSKDKVVFLEGEKFSGFYVVMSGSVKVYKLTADGDETVLHILKPYKSFAETPLFTERDEYPACAQVIEDSTLLHIPKSEFRRLLEESPTLSIKISEAFASRLIELNKKFGQLTASVETKLARYMLGEITSNGSIAKTEPYFILGTTKKDLASQLGIAVETLSRALRNFKDEKIIRESSKRIFVTNLKRLKASSS